MGCEGEVLVVDDDPIVREVLDRYLSQAGYEVRAVGDGRAAMEEYDRSPPDLLVLDLMLPLVDGFEVFRRVRSRGRRTPVIMLTARGDETERVVGLDSGADDYVAKPFSPREVVARVGAVLRRGESEPDEADAEPVAVGRFEVDPRAHEASLDGRPIYLTPKEFDLLLFFARHPRVAFSRSQLLDEVWDVAYDGDPSTVTVHVRRLREKIERDPSAPERLVTVWGAGYRFEP
jgi:two-component system, OmpR family, response regulator ResD